MNLSEKISLILVDKGFSLSPKKNTENLINSSSELFKSNEDMNGYIFWQIINIYFLTKIDLNKI